jgi:hypothetical protein
MNRQFQETFPRSQKNSYNPNDNPRFLLKIPANMELIKNSIAIQGVLKYTKNAAVLAFTPNNDIKYDPQAGVHCFFDNWVTQISQLGITEHLAEYPRYVKMIEQVNSNEVERVCMASKNIELKTSGEKNATQMLVGKAGSTNFSFKPIFAPNRSNRNMSSKDFSQVEISFVLQDQFKACYGADNTTANNCAYTIEGLKMVYMTQPKSQQSEGPLQFKTVSVAKHSIDSQIANIEMVLPINTMSIASSASRRTNLGGTNNNQNIDVIGVNSVKYMFNDTNGKLIAFNMDNYQELMYQYSRVLQMNEDGIDSLAPKTKNYGIGLELGSEQAAGNKVTMLINSDADTGNNIVYELFTYYHGIVGI